MKEEIDTISIISTEKIKMSLRAFDPAYSAQLFGLRNTGVLCYLNSLLQALCACTPFIHEVETAQESNDILTALRSLLARVRSRTSSPGSAPIEYAQELLDTIRAARAERKDTLHLGEQSDAFEGFKFLIEALPPRFEQMFHVRYNNHILCTVCKKQTHSDRSTCPPEITVNMSEKDPLLQKSLDNRSRVEDFLHRQMLYPDGYKCEYCGAANTSGQQLVRQYYTLAMVSSLLVMSFHDGQQLLRAGQMRTARYFPPELTIKGKERTLTYRAVATIDHRGNLGGGHYVAHALRPESSGFGARRLEAAQARRADPRSAAVISHELARAQLPPNSIDRTHRVFQFNDEIITHESSGFTPAPGTYLVFYTFLD